MDGGHRETDFTPEEEWLSLGGNSSLSLGTHADLKKLSESMRQREAKADMEEREFWLNIRNDSEKYLKRS